MRPNAQTAYSSQSFPTGSRTPAVSLASWVFVTFGLTPCVSSRDHGGDWDSEAKRMDEVYMNATVTIALVDGASLDKITAQNRPFISEPHAIRRRLSERTRNLGPGLNSTAHRNPHKPGLSYKECVYAALSETGNFVFRPEGELDTRAWAFQEKFLSRRIVSLTNDGVFWDCLHHSASERRPLGIKGDFSPRFRDSDDRKLRQLLQGSSGLSHTVSTTSHRVSPAELYWLWRQLLADYTSRKLTKSSDRLVAIDGVSQRMSLLLGDDIVAGICRRDAVRSLLWFVDPPAGCDDVHNITPAGAGIAASKLSIAPSWSWAAVQGPIRYRLRHPYASFGHQRSEKFTELAVVKSIQAQQSDNAPFGSCIGRLEVEGFSVECFISDSNVYVSCSEAPWALNSCVGDEDWPCNGVEQSQLDGVLGRYSNLSSSLGGGAPPKPRSRYVKGIMVADRGYLDPDSKFVVDRVLLDPDSNWLLIQAPGCPGYEVARLLLLAVGGYVDLHMGQHCLVLRRVGMAWRRIGICVFDWGDCCLLDPHHCRRCANDRTAETKRCLGRWTRYIIE